MNDQNKIIYYDLKLEAHKLRLQNLIGRSDELARINRIIKRKLHNNCLIIGPSGIGKTALIRGFATLAASLSEYKNTPIIELDSESFYSLGSTTNFIGRFQEALSTLPPCVLILDNLGQLVTNKPLILQNMTRLLKPCLENPKIQVILSLQPSQLQWINEQEAGFTNYLEAVTLKNQPDAEILEILQANAAKFTQAIAAPNSILELILSLAKRFSNLGQLPASAIKILDESLGTAQSMRQKTLTEADVYQVVADKTSIPLSQLKTSELELLKNLEPELQRRVIGQNSAIKTFVNIIQRAKLNLKNPNRPLGSFLVLGPSGVGKTETAKVLAEKIFGKKENFLRLDMSEFSETHTVSRLIGAPPGYVGFDAGGSLTNPIQAEPHSLILLDEIEKAHPKIFDVFLQVLDDGRLTGSTGETVDFTQTILVATSNLAVAEIVQSFEQGQDIYAESFLQTTIMPILTKHFRPEFLNRFDSVVIFKPLSVAELLQIAILEIKKIEERVKKHHIRFNIDQSVLQEKIKNIIDPKFGARPIKRFVEEICETLIANTLLKG